MCTAMSVRQCCIGFVQTSSVAAKSLHPSSPTHSHCSYLPSASVACRDRADWLKEFSAFVAGEAYPFCAEIELVRLHCYGAAQYRAAAATVMQPLAVVP